MPYHPFMFYYTKGCQLFLNLQVSSLLYTLLLVSCVVVLLLQTHFGERVCVFILSFLHLCSVCNCRTSLQIWEWFACVPGNAVMVGWQAVWQAWCYRSLLTSLLTSVLRTSRLSFQLSVDFWVTLLQSTCLVKSSAHCVQYNCSVSQLLHVLPT